MDAKELLEKLGKELDETKQDTVYFDPYRNARDSFLKRNYEDYPNIEFHCFSVAFLIAQRIKYAPLLYAILDAFPEELCKIHENEVSIKINNEKDFIVNTQTIYDLLSVVGAWSSLVVLFNEVSINQTEIGYLFDYIYERNTIKNRSFRKNIDVLKKEYTPTRNKKKIEKPVEQVDISRKNLSEALGRVVDKYIEIFGRNKEVEKFTISMRDIVVKIEDLLIVDFRIIPKLWTQLTDSSVRDWEYPYIMIQELTHNGLFKFNFQGFMRHFRRDYIGIDFFAFHGLDYYQKEIDNYDVIDKALPELELRKRFEQYGGELHHFLLFRMEASDGRVEYGVGVTKNKIHSFVLKLCKELEEKNSRSLELNGASCLLYAQNTEFISAFLSWKGKKKRWRLENKFSYYYEDLSIKNDADTFGILYDMQQEAYKGKYSDCEFGDYSKPLNRWKSEELVYNIVRKLFGEYQVVYQYRPFFLCTDFGNMSYDIYICGLKIAIEYQGKQHFEPIDYFGGRENFEKQQERDKLKAKRSKENGVKLVYINYWENITPQLVRNKIEDAIGTPIDDWEIEK